MKKKLIIDNIGPIKHVELDLKRINVIIGPQSAGKSCILKIACFCAWAEKRIQLEQGKNGFADASYMEENLIDFHKLPPTIKCKNAEYVLSYTLFDKMFDIILQNF